MDVVGTGFPVSLVEVETAPGVTVGAGPAGLAGSVRERLGAARIRHVSSTATGGGVAELLRGSIGRQRLLGLPADWLVADEAPEFFQLTKRIHHGLHGRHSAGGFTAADREFYRAVTERAARRLLAVLGPEDLVVLHDPQTLGTAGHLLAAGRRVAWRCHIGTWSDSPAAEETWELLRPYAERVPQCVFTMKEYVPSYLSPAQVVVIRPSIDPFAAKNRELAPSRQQELLAAVGLTAPGAAGNPVGSTLQSDFLPSDAPAVVQVSRWDPLKDMGGVLRAFADHVAPVTGAHLLLAGPDPADIPDDPEGARIFAEVRRQRELLPEDIRRRVHLIVLSLGDFELNGLVVNAIQRRATVVVQKSLEEGFGLTATEAMWKARPIVAARTGGLTAQLTDQVHGLLVEPADLAGFGAAVTGLLTDPATAARLGAAARERCEAEFLADRELADYLRLYLSML
ncbi:glycosyltransferase [Amycolatopsis nigrescens]|uniref:glycosyltransferase n=1 Tax=Amycolatopsis nigrescens TaxID=381445 RepID=UPI0003814A6D|nr:glycosyltransferase [Amycolatopsis nigrescens]